MKKDKDSTVKLKLGKKKYVIHYIFIPAKREGDDFPSQSLQSPTVEVNYITKRGRRLSEDEIHELATNYEALIEQEALRAEWKKRVEEIEKILALRA